MASPVFRCLSSAATLTFATLAFAALLIGVLPALTFATLAFAALLVGILPALPFTTLAFAGLIGRSHHITTSKLGGAEGILGGLGIASHHTGDQRAKGETCGNQLLSYFHINILFRP